MLDSGSDAENVAGLAKGRFLLQALVRPVAVIVLGVLGQDFTEIPLAEDQHVVQALAAKHAHEPLGECVRPRRPDWRLDHPCGVTGEDVVERFGELAVPVADEEPVATRGRTW